MPQYDAALIAKYLAVVQGSTDPSRTPNEQSNARKIKAKMEARYPGIAEEAYQANVGGGARPTGQGRGGGGAPGFTPPPFDWFAFAGTAGLTFLDFLSKVSADLDRVNTDRDIQGITERVLFKKRTDTKGEIVSLRFDFAFDDLERMTADDASFDVAAKHFAKIAEAGFRKTFGDEEEE